MRKRNLCKLLYSLFCICIIWGMFGTKAEHVFAAEDNFDYYQQLDPNSEEYREWKENLVRPKSMVMARRAVNSSTMISNEYIEFSTLGNGRFTIGTVEGNPDIDTDNEKKMLFGHPISSASYTTVRIDGVTKTFKAESVSYDRENARSIATAKYDDINVIQTLSIVKNRNTSRDEVIKISYELKNTSNNVKTVGLRIMLDTMLGGNDAAPFRVDGCDITKETEFSGENLPKTWMAFDTLLQPGVVSQGTLYQESGEKKPDKVQFVNWPYAYGNSWNYAIKSDENNFDSAVTITWNEETLEPGDSFTYSTYYGLSELTYDLVPPVALGVYLNQSTLQYNGIYENLLASAYIQNIGSGNANNVKLWIETDDNFKVVGTDTTKEIAVMKRGNSDTHTWQLEVNKVGRVPTDSEGVIKVKLQYTEADTGKIVNKEIIKHITICKNTEEKQAIIVVPGIMGSRLQDDDGNVIWPSARTLTDSIKCDEYGNCKEGTGTISSSTEYGTLDTYENLINELRNDYGENYDIVFAPYDWRLGLDKCVEEVKSYIDNYDKVAVVAHSMGGLVLEQYVHDYGPDKIVKVVTLGTPFWGSAMAARAEYDGYLEAASGFGGTLIEGMVENFEGVYSLLPNSHYTNIHNWCSFTTNEYETIWDYFTHANHETEVRDWNGTKDLYMTYYNEYLVNQALGKLDALSSENTCELDKVNITYIVGNGCVTDSEVDFFDGLVASGLGGAMAMKVSSAVPNNYGDGTVSMISATMNRVNANVLNNDKIQYLGNFVVVNNVNHINLAKDGDVIIKIKNALNECIIPDSGLMITQYSMNSTNDGIMAIDNTEPHEDYEDTSRVVKLIVIGDMDIDFYNKQGELKYYYHPNSEIRIQDGPDFTVGRIGEFGEQSVVIANFNKDDYIIKLTSNQNQISQIGILQEEDLQTLSDFNLLAGDIVKISYSPDKSNVYYNEKEIEFDGENNLVAEDVSIMSLDINSQDESNTIAARIKLKNCGNKAIALNKIKFGYIFNPDGLDNHIAEFDWACNNNSDITRTVHGEFEIVDAENMQLSILFDNEQMLEAGNELEIHFRIHTTDWQNYDLTNDYSRNCTEYSTNDRMLFYYGDELICGEEYAND